MLGLMAPSEPVGLYWKIFMSHFGGLRYIHMPTIKARIPPVAPKNPDLPRATPRPIPTRIRPTLFTRFIRVPSSVSSNAELRRLISESLVILERETIVKFFYISTQYKKVLKNF